MATTQDQKNLAKALHVRDGKAEQAIDGNNGSVKAAYYKLRQSERSKVSKPLKAILALLYCGVLYLFAVSLIAAIHQPTFGNISSAIVAGLLALTPLTFRENLKDK